jgi:hypothetical protein
MVKKYSKTFAAMAGATIVLAALIGTASAGKLRASSQTFRGVWTAMSLTGPGVSISCPVTLEGSLHSTTINKVAESLIGYITRAIAGEGACSGATARTLTETLPWHLRYTSFEGRLPDITAINTRIVLAAFQIRATIFGIPVTCLYRTSAASPATARFNRTTPTGVINSVAAGGAISSAGGCPTGTLGGNSNAPSVLNETRNITVTLI